MWAKLIIMIQPAKLTVPKNQLTMLLLYSWKTISALAAGISGILRYVGLESLCDDDLCLGFRHGLRLFCPLLLVDFASVDFASVGAPAG